MSELTVFADGQAPQELERTQDPARIEQLLDGIGVTYERWQATAELGTAPEPAQVIEAYRADIDRLMAREGFRSVDVISLYPEHPEREALRQKFLDEHTHSEPEVRFFVAGSGLFTLHAGDQVYAMRATRGDLLGVPAGMRHWFDMGPAPSFTAIRLFTDPAGWAANFTGDDIARRYPRFEAA